MRNMCNHATATHVLDVRLEFDVEIQCMLI